MLDGDEVRQRVPQPGGDRPLRDPLAHQRPVVAAVRLGAGGHVVAPAHVVAVHQVGQVGPRVDRLPRRWAAAVAHPAVGGVAADQLGTVHARRGGPAGAQRRPLRDLPQVLGQAPGADRLEHPVLEHVAVGVGPVVRDVAAGGGSRACRKPVPLLQAPGCSGRAVVVGATPCGEEAMKPAVVEVGGEVAEESWGPPPLTSAWSAYRWWQGTPAAGRQAGDRDRPCRPGTRSRRGRCRSSCQGAVLLHHHHDVLDLVDAADRVHRRGPCPSRRRGASGPGGLGHRGAALVGGHGLAWAVSRELG